MREIFRKLLRWLTATAAAVYRFILHTHAARLAIMALRLWRGTPLPALLVFAVFLFCLHLGGSAGLRVHAVLLPASPSGIGATVAGVVAGLVALELAAAFGIMLMTAALQLAYDTGRHRVLSLLAIASVLAVGGLAWRFADTPPGSLSAVLLPSLATGGLVALTIWFERAYLRAAYPGFRDFWADIVDARHFLNRAAHGE